MGRHQEAHFRTQPTMVFSTLNYTPYQGTNCSEFGGSFGNDRDRAPWEASVVMNFPDHKKKELSSLLLNKSTSVYQHTSCPQLGYPTVGDYAIRTFGREYHQQA